MKVKLIEEYSSNRGVSNFEFQIEKYLKTIKDYSIQYGVTTTNRGILYTALIIHKEIKHNPSDSKITVIKKKRTRNIQS